MSRNKSQQFHCGIVNEMVQICLTKRRGRGFGGESYHFIQCDQVDCQYVDANVPPCPLHLEQFADELREEEEKKKER